MGSQARPAADSGNRWRVRLVQQVKHDFNALLASMEDAIDAHHAGYRALGAGDVRDGLTTVTKIVLACVLYDRQPVDDEIGICADLAAHRGSQGVAPNILASVMDAALQAALTHILSVAAALGSDVPSDGFARVTDRVLAAVRVIKEAMTSAASAAAGDCSRPAMRSVEVWVERVLARRWTEAAELVAAAPSASFRLGCDVGLLVLAARDTTANQLPQLAELLWREPGGAYAPGRPAATPVPHMPLLVAEGAVDRAHGALVEPSHPGVRVVWVGMWALARAADAYEWCRPNLAWTWAAPAPGTLVNAVDLAHLALLAAEPARRRSLWTAVMGRLEGHPEEARVWCAVDALVEHGSVAAAASALRKSRDTLTYSVDLLAAMTGYDWRDWRCRRAIETAVLCRRLELADGASVLAFHSPGEEGTAAFRQA